MNDSYDIAKKILELYSANVNKSSGEISKNSMLMPLWLKSGSNYYLIEDVTFEPDVGIVLKKE